MTCTKRKHGTEAEALSRLFRIWRVGHGRMPHRVYLCDCGSWHTTSAPMRDRVSS
jgi:hypothetical protein